MGACDPGPATSAGAYDALAGGKDWYQPDADLAARIEAICPDVRQAVAANRLYLGRAAGWAASRGVTQIVDLGCGMLRPGQDIGDMARSVNPAVRVAYIDSDADAAWYAQVVTDGDPATAAACGDLRDPDSILADAAVAELIDPGEPVLVILGAVLHYLPPAEGAQAVAAWAERITPGSCITVTVPRFVSPPALEQVKAAYTPAGLWHYGDGDMAGLFGGLDMVPPGTGWVAGMRPGWADAICEPRGRGVYTVGGLAEKPLPRRENKRGQVLRRPAIM